MGPWNNGCVAEVATERSSVHDPTDIHPQCKLACHYSCHGIKSHACWITYIISSYYELFVVSGRLVVISCLAINKSQTKWPMHVPPGFASKNLRVDHPCIPIVINWGCIPHFRHTQIHQIVGCIWLYSIVSPPEFLAEIPKFLTFISQQPPWKTESGLSIFRLPRDLRFEPWRVLQGGRDYE